MIKYITNPCKQSPRLVIRTVQSIQHRISIGIFQLYQYLFFLVHDVINIVIRYIDPSVRKNTGIQEDEPILCRTNERPVIQNPDVFAGKRLTGSISLQYVTNFTIRYVRITVVTGCGKLIQFPFLLHHMEHPFFDAELI